MQAAIRNACVSMLKKHPGKASQDSRLQNKVFSLCQWRDAAARERDEGSLLVIQLLCVGAEQHYCAVPPQPTEEDPSIHFKSP